MDDYYTIPRHIAKVLSWPLAIIVGIGFGAFVLGIASVVIVTVAEIVGLDLNLGWVFVAVIALTVVLTVVEQMPEWVEAWRCRSPRG